MSRFSRPVRLAGAGLLAVSALTVFGASPASAAATGTLTPDGSGGLVVTYSGTAQNDILDFVVQVAGTPCATNSANEIAVLVSYPGVPPQFELPASPASIVVGTSMYFNNLQGNGPLPAGPYTFCLVNRTGQPPSIVVAQIDMTLSQVPVTTTTAPTTTTTAPAADPVAPSFTG